jgi:hypothetical protein
MTLKIVDATFEDLQTASSDSTLTSVELVAHHLRPYLPV